MLVSDCEILFACTEHRENTTQRHHVGIVLLPPLASTKSSAVTTLRVGIARWLVAAALAPDTDATAAEAALPSLTSAASESSTAEAITT